MVMVLMVFGLVACGSDSSGDDPIDTTPISMIVGKDKVIQGADTISSLNRFVAYGNKNTVHGWHVGETTVTVNGSSTISVKVLPTSNLYNDPICEWGCSMDYVKQNQKQGTLSSKSTNSILAYENAGGASLLAYSFESGKLSSVLAVVSSNHTSTLGTYLAERFLMLPYYQGKDVLFGGIDAIDEVHAKTLVVTELYNVSNWTVFYGPYKKSATRSNKIDEKEKMIEILHPFLTK